MKCYYHVELGYDAVGQCPQCGKGLCRDCINAHGGICEDCYSENVTTEYVNVHANYISSKKDYRNGIIKALVIGLIGYIVIFTLLLWAEGWKLTETALYATLLLGHIPLGVAAINRVFGKDPDTAETNRLAFLAAAYGSDIGCGWLIGQGLLFILKVIIAEIIGIPSLFILIIKLIITNGKIKKSEEEYKKIINQ